MRRLASLLESFRDVCNNKLLTGEEMLERKRFGDLETAIENLCSNDEKPSLKVALGFHLKSAAKTMKGMYLMDTDDDKATEMDKFLTLLDLHWGAIFTKAQFKINDRRQQHLRRPQELPVESDMLKINSFIKNELEKLMDDPYLIWGQYDYNRLRAICVCRLTLFNARRRGEPARLLRKEWNDGENGAWVDPQQVENIEDEIEKCLVGSYMLTYQRGKGTKLVPLIIPRDIVQPIKKLLSIRKDAGVSDANPYVFAYTENSNNHVSGWACVHEVAQLAEVTNIALMTATKVRHRASTTYALLDVPQQDRETFYRHMGHSKEVNESIYQCPLGITELTRVGRFLEDLDQRPGENLDKEHYLHYP